MNKDIKNIITEFVRGDKQYYRNKRIQMMKDSIEHLNEFTDYEDNTSLIEGVCFGHADIFKDWGFYDFGFDKEYNKSLIEDFANIYKYFGYMGFTSDDSKNFQLCKNVFNNGWGEYLE